MLDQLTGSPMAAIGFIFFVIVLGGIYLVNRERSQVQRMRGPRRFQPDWRRSGSPRSRTRRRRRSGGAFKPAWNERPSGRERNRDAGSGEDDSGRDG